MQGICEFYPTKNYGDFSQTCTREIAVCGFVATYKKGQSAVEN